MKTRKLLSGSRSAALLFIMAGLLATDMLVAQSWYDAAWGYRVPVAVTDTAGTALTNYQVEVRLDSSFPWANVDPDGDDIRFTASDGTALLDYWIESWTYQDNAVIWVEVPSIAANTSTTIYLYYGNSSAPSASNGENTFKFFDDFNGSSLDLTRWTPDGDASLLTVSGGFLNLVSTNFNSIIINTQGITSWGMNNMVEARARHLDQGTLNLIMSFGFLDNDYNGTRVIDDYVGDGSTTYWQRETRFSTDNPVDVTVNMAQTADQEWHIFRVGRAHSDTASYQVDRNAAEVTETNVTALNLPLHLQSYSGLDQTNTVVADWVRLRNWSGSDPEAIIGISQVESLNHWTGNVSTDWNVAGNWSAGVPGTEDNVAIFDAANDPVISSGTVTCGTVVIEPSASLTINSGATLTVSSLTINSAGVGNSGSLINLGTCNGTVTYNRFLRPADLLGDRHFFASPVSGLTFSGFITANSDRINTSATEYLWGWNEADGTWPAYTASSSASFVSGLGYNVDQASGSTGLMVFTGSAINSSLPTITVTSPYYPYSADYSSYADGRDPDNGGTYGGGGWNLLGNPFLSAMTVSDADAVNTNDFISANSGSFDPSYMALYVYDGTAGQHGTYDYDNTVVQVGQGFWVLPLENGVSFTFNNDMQVHNSTLPVLKSSRIKTMVSGFKLKVRYGANESRTAVLFEDGMTPGLDPGHDIGQLSTGPDVEIYTALVEDNGVNFTRQSLPASGNQKITIPVGVDSEKGGQVTFSADVSALRNYKFWLEDRATGVFTNLNTDSYYVNLPAETYGTGRFFVHVSVNRPVRQRTDDSKLQQLRIWSSQNRRINIQGEVSNNAVCEVFDIYGRKVVTTGLTDGDFNTITLPEGINGIIVVKVTDGAKVTTNKIPLL